MNGWNIAATTSATIAMICFAVGEYRRVRIRREVVQIRRRIAQLIHESAADTNSALPRNRLTP